MTCPNCHGPAVTRVFILVKYVESNFAARVVTRNLRHPRCFFGCGGGE